MADKKPDGKKSIDNNKKAYHDYFVDETMEAGIQLFGTEVNSVRCGGVNLKDSYCSIEDGELCVTGMHISPYEKGNIYNRDTLREKKLLMHKREILRLLGKVGQEGVTLVPLSLYFKGSRVKVELGICRGKKLYDKREDLAKKQANRDIERYTKSKNRED